VTPAVTRFVHQLIEYYYYSVAMTRYIFRDGLLYREPVLLPERQAMPDPDIAMAI
jgi:hypothetical protein